MPTPLEPVVGDRVKLINRATGDEAIVTATVVSPRAITSKHNWFGIVANNGGWEVVEILEPVLPTEPGLYAANGHSNQRYLMLTAEGNWWWVDWSYTGSLSNADHHVARYASTMKKVFPL